MSKGQGVMLYFNFDLRILQKFDILASEKGKFPTAKNNITCLTDVGNYG